MIVNLTRDEYDGIYKRAGAPSSISDKYRRRVFTLTANYEIRIT